MLRRQDRLQAVQHLLGEIGESVDQGDRMAVRIRIQGCLQRGQITTRDAERLHSMLNGLHGPDSYSMAG